MTICFWVVFRGGGVGPNVKGSVITAQVPSRNTTVARPDTPARQPNLQNSEEFRGMAKHARETSYRNVIVFAFSLAPPNGRRV